MNIVSYSLNVICPLKNFKILEKGQHEDMLYAYQNQDNIQQSWIQDWRQTQYFTINFVSTWISDLFRTFNTVTFQRTKLTVQHRMSARYHANDLKIKFCFNLVVLKKNKNLNKIPIPKPLFYWETMQVTIWTLLLLKQYCLLRINSCFDVELDLEPTKLNSKLSLIYWTMIY